MNRFLQDIKSVFTEINLDYNSGIVVVNDSVDPSYLKKIRIWNLVEGFSIYGLILLIVWTSMLDTSLWWMWAGLGSILIWILFLTPLIHYKFEKDIFLTEEQKKRGIWFYWCECRGLGSPKRYYFSVNGEKPQIKEHFKKIIILVIFIDLLFASLLYTYPSEAQSILSRMINAQIPIVILYIIFFILIDILMIFIMFPLMLRLDNFGASFKFIIAFIILSIPLIIAFNFMFQILEQTVAAFFEPNPYMRFREPSAAERWANFNIIAFFSQWSGYIFWGWLQQLLFLSVFNTYFARGFDIRKKSGLIACCLFTALFFALIHIPNFWLSLFTFIPGFFWSLYFVQARNLFAMGFVHGFGGSLLNKLVPINFSVGPSQVSN
ncbi:MAG: CPBP family glutamic-type intramembrane protease [Promethearchaeia archaeon]